MKKSYDKTVRLRCVSCGDTNFEFNDEKTWVKCTRCNREYQGGYDELLALNQGTINTELEETATELKKDLQKEMHNMLKEVFKNNKNIKIK